MPGGDASATCICGQERAKGGPPQGLRGPVEFFTKMEMRLCRRTVLALAASIAGAVTVIVLISQWRHLPAAAVETSRSSSKFIANGTIQRRMLHMPIGLSSTRFSCELKSQVRLDYGDRAARSVGRFQTKYSWVTKEVPKSCARSGKHQRYALDYVSSCNMSLSSSMQRERVMTRAKHRQTRMLAGLADLQAHLSFLQMRSRYWKGLSLPLVG